MTNTVENGIIIDLDDSALAAVAAQRAIDGPVHNVRMLKIEAQTLLEKSDIQILRCGECNISVPAEWATYRASLRLIAKSGTGDIPSQPAYPQGI